MIIGDMFFKGNIGENGGSVTGITYTVVALEERFFHPTHLSLK